MRNHHQSIRHSIHLGAAWEPPVPTEADGFHLWTRRFGRPGGLQPADRVLLVVTQPAVAADVMLNGARLPPLSPAADRWSQDITALLRERNELFLTVAAASGHNAPNGRTGRGLLPSGVGRVALEIVSADGAVDHSLDA